MTYAVASRMRQQQSMCQCLGDFTDIRHHIQQKAQSFDTVIHLQQKKQALEKFNCELLMYLYVKQPYAF